MMLGIAVSPIWVIMLSSVEEDKRGKQMGYVYFSWLLGLLVGMVFMNLLIKVHPTRFAFMMSLSRFNCLDIILFCRCKVNKL